MIPIAVPELAGNEERYLSECISTGFVSSVGPFVERFEAQVAEAAVMPGAVATNSGTAGLHAALCALGVHRDDLVILPSYTFIGSANAISLSGASPWLVDVDPETWTLTQRILERALAESSRREGKSVVHTTSGRRVAAIMPVHTFGLPADLCGLAEIARSYGLPIVADAAAALGATLHGGSPAVGADFSVFSFNGNKTVTAGGGGAVTGPDTDRLRRLHHLTTTARVGSDYVHDKIGFNYRMTNLQAAVGCAQLERLETLIARKRAIRASYDRALSDLPGLSPFPSAAWARSACWLSGAVLAPDRASEFAQLSAVLTEAGIEARPFWRPVHLQPAYNDAARESDLRVSESIWERILVLPSSAGLRDEDQARVIDTLRKAL